MSSFNWKRPIENDNLVDLSEFSGDGVNDETPYVDVPGDERMARDGRDRLPDGTFRIVEALQPGGDDAKRRIGCVLQRGCKSLIHCTLLVYLPSEKTGGKCINC